MSNTEEAVVQCNALLINSVNGSAITAPSRKQRSTTAKNATRRRLLHE